MNKKGGSRKSLKKKKGVVAQYMTRNQAIKRLQVTLPDFRRLCILKGVYPRDPSKKVYGKDKVYYYAKDILWLSHERVLHSFRELKAFLKKFKKAVAKGDVTGARKLEEYRPQYSLNHIVRERYPSFVDSLRDLDDAICMITLFSTMPSDDKIVRSRVENCQKLLREFQAYVMRNRCLKKVFLSVKGVYYQAEVQGEKITWISPYKFTPTVDADVDLKVMLTFLEFYEVLLHFVNYKLYHEAALVYPPALDAVWAPNTKGGAGLAAINGLRRKDEGMDDEDGDELNPERSTLFKDCVFFLGREVPVESLVFIITSHGGQVHWGDHPQLDYEHSTAVTHQVVDRPKLLGEAIEGREYIQPQWVYDSVNAAMLLPTFEYGVGQSLPPHISPFVDDDAEGYIPQRKQYLSRLKGDGAEGEEGEEDDEEDEEEQEEANLKSTAEEDQAQLAKSLLSRKKRNLYTHIKKEEDAKKEKVELLTKKRKGGDANTTSKKKSKTPTNVE